ncbi:GldG family protein [Treponema parvum]|uniref:GldG family protein n=1 Tax=Treponema parvum TaxID=138851 RepID=UPI001AEC2FE7|nr:GldG family protein [Treponema parvum]QTQ15909.1 GldG family protein [Treponema parvum]
MSKKYFYFCLILSLISFSAIGFCAVYLTNNFGAKLDFTEKKLYTLSSATKKILSSLEEDITITVYNRETDFPIFIKNLLDSYKPANKHISIEYCDPYSDPQTIRKMKDRGFEIAENDISVESDNCTKLLKIENLYKLNLSGNKVEQLLAEQKISSAIDFVTTDDRKTVLFTDGHGEEPSVSLEDVFENNHFKVALSEISVLGIDPETILIVICAPKKDFTEDEISLLEKYLRSGGSVMLFAEPGSSGLSNLSYFLKDRGIGLTDSAIHEPKLYISGNQLNIVANYCENEINTYFTHNRRYVIAPSSSEVTQEYINQGRTNTAQVLRTTSESFSEDGSIGSKGICVSSVRKNVDKNGLLKDQKLIVFGSKLIYGDDLLCEEKLANFDFVVQATAWLIGDYSLLAIPPKTIEAYIIPVTASQSSLYGIITMGGIPAIILLLGFIVLFRRKYL